MLQNFFCSNALLIKADLSVILKRNQVTQNLCPNSQGRRLRQKV